MRRLKVSEHRRCRATILIGDCDYGFETYVDPGPLDVAGEAIAVLTARRILELRRDRGTWVLDHREPVVSTLRLSGYVATFRPALAEHVCGAPLSSEPGPSAVELISTRALVIPDPDAEPPF